MEKAFPFHPPQFFTATIHDWQHALADDKHKDIIIDSLKFLVNDKRIELNAFVIMSNHIHLIWQPLFGHTPFSVQSSLAIVGVPPSTREAAVWSLTNGNLHTNNHSS